MTDKPPKFKHKRCPQWCHRCPDMGGEIMPWCMGTIIRDSCTCVRPKREPKTPAESKIRALERKVEKLTAAVQELAKELKS